MITIRAFYDDDNSAAQDYEPDGMRPDGEWVSITLPIMPRIGELVYLSDEQTLELIKKGAQSYFGEEDVDEDSFGSHLVVTEISFFASTMNVYISIGTYEQLEERKKKFMI